MKGSLRYASFRTELLPSTHTLSCSTIVLAQIALPDRIGSCPLATHRPIFRTAEANIAALSRPDTTIQLAHLAHSSVAVAAGDHRATSDTAGTPVIGVSIV